MNPQEAAHALSKQLPSIVSLNTGCGELKLTPEMKKIVQDSLFPILSKIITQYGFKHFCKSCGRGLFLSEILSSPRLGLCSDCYEKELQARGES